MTVGVNLNNREALITAGYDLRRLLDLAVRAEARGFDSVWVGDSLFSKPRWDPIVLLSAAALVTRRVRLGTACLMVSQRHPLHLAQQWATLDALSGGRTVLGACAGNAEARVRAEFAALGLPYRHRFELLEEAVQVLRQAWSTGRVDFEGRHLRFHDVAWHSGTERTPLRPVQERVPVWIVSNPWLGRPAFAERAARRVAGLADGWLSCCAESPRLVREHLERIRAARDRPLAVAYQVTLHLARSREEAERGLREYVAAYYPEWGAISPPASWGPYGTAAEVREWFREYRTVGGVEHFIVRFAARDQTAQLERFAEEVLPYLS
jgi:alkanesulfonate monooxygenase SsuD/methylene tetrahydromethanopterin reductase-like flavin-dependent oxidoreductase (luciferase family)